MSGGAKVRQVAEVCVGDYRVELDAEKMEILGSYCNCSDDSDEIRDIRRVSDMVLNICTFDAWVPTDEECLLALKSLNSLRCVFEKLREVGVMFVKGGVDDDKD